MFDNKLIYGKDATEGIVSIEVKDDQVYAYFNDGSYKTQPARYFICSTFNIGKKFMKLEGINDFKYAKSYGNFEEYLNDRKQLYRYKDSVYTVSKPEEMHMLIKGSTLFKNLKFEEVSRLGFDIESDGLQHHKDSTVYMISNTFRDGKGGETKKVFRVDHYENAGDMIVDWCNYVRKTDPTLMVGHNVIGYDIPYLSHVASLHGKELNLGRDGSDVKIASRPRNYRVDGIQTWEYRDTRVFGRHVVDTMFLSVKYDIGRNFPGWGLKPIIEHLGMVKDGREFYDASQIYKNWSNPIEREKIVQYGIDDGDDALNLYELMAPSFFYLTQSIPKNFQEMINTASGGWINSLFVRSYLQDMKSIPKKSEVSGFQGALSYGVPGVYSNCFKQDVASLYPSIMRQHSICDKAKDPEEYFPKVVEYFTLERLKNKKLANDTKDPYYRALEQSQKIVINSMYGFLGAPGLNFNSPDNASLVTEIGREILTKAMNWSTNQDLNFWRELPPHTPLNEINNGSELVLVNCDTDSIMVTYKDGRKWSEEMKKDFLDRMNEEFEDLIIWEDDGEYDRVVVVKSKNYVLLENGSDKLKFKGSSFKDAKKEPALKQMMLDMCSALVYTNKQVKDIYEECIQEILNLKDISKWSTKKSITENLLLADSTAKTKVLDAIKGTDFRVGDKVYLFNDIDGEIQHVAKGEKVFKKNGEPKMVTNNIYRRKEDFTGSYDLKHYLKRAYSTANILCPVINMEEIKNYSLVKNYKELLDDQPNLI